MATRFYFKIDLNWEVLEESVVPNYLVNIVLRQIEADATIRNDGTERQDKHLMGGRFQQGKHCNAK